MTVPLIDERTETEIADALPCDFPRNRRRCDHAAAWIVHIDGGMHEPVALACVDHATFAAKMHGQPCKHCGVTVWVNIEPIRRAT